MTGSDCVQDEKNKQKHHGKKWKPLTDRTDGGGHGFTLCSSLISRIYIQAPSSALAVLRILQPGAFRFVDPWVSSTPE